VWARDHRPILTTLEKFPEVFAERLHEGQDALLPSFDVDAALASYGAARQTTAPISAQIPADSTPNRQVKPPRRLRTVNREPSRVGDCHMVPGGPYGRYGSRLTAANSAPSMTANSGEAI
jgi:hypothetical protein